MTVSHPTFVIGIAGGSGSGKTTLARKLEKALGAEVLAQDRYYIDQSARFDGDGGSVNFDHPDSIEFSLLAKQLRELKAGQDVETPNYDFATHKRSKKTDRFVPARYLIVEGTLILSQSEVRKELDLAIFIEARENVRFERRLRRDTQERGRTPDGVKKQFDLQVKPMHDEFVEPSKSQADVVLSGEASIDLALKQALERISAARGG